MEATISPQGFTFGADPELFVLNPDGKVVSCHDFLPGTKARPYAVPGGAVQVDGTAAEFNINPSATFEEFNNNMNSVLDSLRSMLPAGHTLAAIPAHEYEEDYFNTLPYLAIELGCMPDFDAWTGRRNPKPKLKGRHTLRTAAGHLHIGWEGDHSLQDIRFLDECNRMIRLMDWHLGAWACTIDEDRTRRELYGKAGACRYKPYGVEYRVLSNFWVLDEDLRLAVWNRMQAAVWDFASAVEAPPSEELVAFINTGEEAPVITPWLQ